MCCGRGTTALGRLLDEKVPNTLVNRLLRRLDAGHERIHNFRHTAATVAGDVSGGDLHAIKTLLGHQSIAVTADLYRHVMPDAVRRVGDAIGEYYRDTPKVAGSDQS